LNSLVDEQPKEVACGKD